MNLACNRVLKIRRQQLRKLKDDSINTVSFRVLPAVIPETASPVGPVHVVLSHQYVTQIISFKPHHNPTGSVYYYCYRYFTYGKALFKSHN